MTKGEALMEVVRQTYANKNTKTSHKRLTVALGVLGIEEEGIVEVEVALEYRNYVNKELYHRFTREGKELK